MATRKDKTAGWSARDRPRARAINLNALPPPAAGDLVRGYMTTRRLAVDAGDVHVVQACDRELTRYGVVVSDQSSAAPNASQHAARERLEDRIGLARAVVSRWMS